MSRKSSIPSQPSLFGPSKGIDLRTHKTIRLAVGGDVPLNRLETALADARDFQRLRRLRQLGTTHLVYPTALHTRFDHSLGTLATAIEMIRSIRENPNLPEEERRIEPDEEQLARLLALLHDVAHVPFGHTLEDEFGLFPRHDEDPERRERFFGPKSELGSIVRSALGADLCERLWALMRADRSTAHRLGDDLFVYDLVNNTICADLLDYLRRDSFFCGISLDLDYRFLRHLRLRRVGGTRRAVVRVWKEGAPGPRADVVSELVRLLDDRYLMGERVYFHHAKLASGTMVAGAVARAVAAGELKRERLWDLDDDGLLHGLARCGHPSARRLAESLLDRRLWKGVVDVRRSEAERTGRMDLLLQTWRGNPGRRVELEDAIAADLGAASGDVLAHCPAAGMAMKLAETMVEWNGEIRAFKDCADDPVVEPRLRAILESHRNLWAFRVFVAPELRGEAATIAKLVAEATEERSESPAGNGARDGGRGR